MGLVSGFRVGVRVTDFGVRDVGVGVGVRVTSGICGNAP